jgi:DNA-binding protein HU-beta
MSRRHTRRPPAWSAPGVDTGIAQAFDAAVPRKARGAAVRIAGNARRPGDTRPAGTCGYSDPARIFTRINRLSPGPRPGHGHRSRIPLPEIMLMGNHAGTRPCRAAAALARFYEKNLAAGCKLRANVVRQSAGLFNNTGDLSMNKSELIDAVADKADLTKAAAGRAVDAVIEQIVTTVAKGDNVTLVGFGTFKSAARAAREGKNPKTGEKIKIAATTVPKFSAGATFKEKVAAKKGKKK